METSEPAAGELSGLTALLQAIDVGELVPAEYGAYRAPIADALAFFLERLPPARLADVLTVQADLPPNTDAAHRLVAVMRQCPTLHKLGQVVARDRRLDAGLRRRLQSLESAPAEVPAAWIRSVLDRELDPDTLAHLSLEPTALAEASVAVVIAGRFDTGDQPIDVVLKVLKPDIETRLSDELDILASVGAFLDERTARYELPALSYERAFDEVRTLLRHEVDLEVEQANLRRARHLYGGMAHVLVPEPVDSLCTAAVTGMTRLYGSKITDHPSLDSAGRQRLAASLVEALLVRPLFDATPEAMFHADPHAGNLLADDAGRLGILDWSLTGHLSKNVREHLVQIVLGALTLDRTRIARAIRSLALQDVDEERLAALVHAAVDELRVDRLPGLPWLVSLLDAAVLHAGVVLDGDLMAFRKLLLTLDGVLLDVCEDHRTDWVLAAAACKQLQREWPARWLSPWTSRAFDTHVSTADLIGLAWTTPQTLMQLWARSWSDITSATTRH